MFGSSGLPVAPTGEFPGFVNPTERPDDDEWFVRPVPERERGRRPMPQAVSDEG